MKLLYVEGSDEAAKSFVDLAGVQSKIRWQIRRVRDAYEGIDYLSGFKDFADRTRFPLPQMLVLKLSPRTFRGLDLLAWLRGESRFRHVPVVVTTLPGGSADEGSAFELAPAAWFVRSTGYHEVLGLCEHLALNKFARAPKANLVQEPFTLLAATA